LGFYTFKLAQKTGGAGTQKKHGDGILPKGMMNLCFPGLRPEGLNKVANDREKTRYNVLNLGGGKDGQPKAAVMRKRGGLTNIFGMVRGNVHGQRKRGRQETESFYQAEGTETLLRGERTKGKIKRP